VITLSVVVPATDAPITLGRCTMAIAAADDPPDELVVVDGPASLSAAAARNEGVDRATSEVVVFVDADVEVHPDAFTRIRAAFEAQPTLTAVFGSYDDAPDHPGTVSAFRNLLHHHVHHASAGLAETFWTGLGAVRRADFLAVGGFDADRYPHPSIEDIDLGDRLHAGGAMIQLDPGVQGKHLKVWTLRSMLWTDFARRGMPWVALQLRNRRVSNALNCGWRHRASAVLCAALVIAAIATAPWIAAGAAASLVALNCRFYVLLSMRLGSTRALAGIGLHGLHHLVSVVAVPVGLAAAIVSDSPAAALNPQFGATDAAPRRPLR
jgi:hypothetical protein